MAPKRIVSKPEGLEYQPEFITQQEEQSLLDWFDTLQFIEVIIDGVDTGRRIRQYGVVYNRETREVVPARPLPAELEQLLDRCARYAGVPAADIAQALINKYPAGATMYWHTDGPAFGENVMGVSLGEASMLNLQKQTEGGQLYWEQPVERRSSYLMRGEVRHQWQHSIPAISKGVRYSVTFRTLA